MVANLVNEEQSLQIAGQEQEANEYIGCSVGIMAYNEEANIERPSICSGVCMTVSLVFHPSSARSLPSVMSSRAFLPTVPWMKFLSRPLFLSLATG